MAVYWVGDVQGCDAPLGRLLERVDFSASRDTLVVLGDFDGVLGSDANPSDGEQGQQVLQCGFKAVLLHGHFGRQQAQPAPDGHPRVGIHGLDRWRVCGY